jgi:streptogramin lyase
MRTSTAALLSTLALLLTGCGMGARLTPTVQPGTALQGHVHGGQQPVAGAHVYLFAANTTGYGGVNLPPTSSNASISLLSVAATGFSDGAGAYVLSDASGNFNISGDYTCAPGSQVYLYAHGGNPGGGTNSAAGFLALIGNCPAAGNFATIPFIEMNEVSTVAAAYSIAGYTSDPLHVSSNGSPQALTGIANAFATATNLVDLGSGVALTTTPAGNGTVPQATLNTLGNILASCVNSADTTAPGLPYSATCVALGEATSGNNLNQYAGYTYDTSTAAIFIAQAPGAYTAALYALPTPKAPFSPVLTSQPADWTLSIAFTGGNLSDAGRPSVDAQGNVWVADYSGVVAKFSPLGLLVSSAWTESGFHSPASAAIDASGNAWINNTQPGSSLTEYSSSGTQLNTSGATGIQYFVPNSPVIDPSGNLWVLNENFTSDLVKFSSSGAFIQTFTGNGIGGPHSLAVDASGNLWVGNSFTVSKFTNAGGSAAGSPYSLSDSTNPAAVAVDASGRLWVVKNDLAVDVLNSSGSEIAGSPYNSTYNAPNGTLIPSEVFDGSGSDWIASSYTDFFTYASSSTFTQLADSGSLVAAFTVNNTSQIGGLALDSAGNLWAPAGNQLLEYVGLSAPIETPLIQAVKDNCLAQRPCTAPL